jgi:hypothetical protein
MKIPSDEIYLKIQQISTNVKEKLKHQGIVVPVKKRDGSIQIGAYSIKKEGSGFYSILDFKNEVIINRINLPQTAAIQANRLALGKYVDDKVLEADTKYGHACFDEELHTHLAERSLQKKDLDKAEMMYTKSTIARHKKNQHMFEVKKGFEKLMRFR